VKTGRRRLYGWLSNDPSHASKVGASEPVPPGDCYPLEPSRFLRVTSSNRIETVPTATADYISSRSRAPCRAKESRHGPNLQPIANADSSAEI
jgi:hypothetical protein